MEKVIVNKNLLNKAIVCNHLFIRILSVSICTIFIWIAYFYFDPPVEEYNALVKNWKSPIITKINSINLNSSCPEHFNPFKIPYNSSLKGCSCDLKKCNNQPNIVEIFGHSCNSIEIGCNCTNLPLKSEGFAEFCVFINKSVTI